MTVADDPPARVDALSAPVAAWLVDDGLGHLDAAAAALDDGADTLAVGTRLRADGLRSEQAAAVLDTARSRLRLRADGHPDADRLVVTSAALEQASPRAAARWRRTALDRVGGDPADVVDLCAGAGLDSRVLAEDGRRVTAVEWDEARATLARHNLAELAATVVVGDAMDQPLRTPVHADPGRRDTHGRRSRTLADTLPPVARLVERWRSQPSTALAVSCSPAVSLRDPDLPRDAELAFLEVGDVLVDAVVLLGDVVAGTRRAVLLDRDGGVQAEVHGSATSPTSQGRRAPGRLDRVGGSHRGERPDVVGSWLVEARPSLVRARLHDAVGDDAGLVPASARRALLLGLHPPGGPWFTARQVVADLPARPRALRRWLATAEARPVEWVLHGVREDVARLHAQAGRPPRGPGGWRAELVAVEGGRRLLVTDAASVVRARGS